MSLFITPPTIDPKEYLTETEARKVAGIKLTSSPSFWDDEIVQNLLRDHPYIPPQRVVVNFKRKDEAQGAAFGYIGIIGAPHVSIPVVIKNRELSPLDIIIVRNNQQGQNEQVQQGSGDMTDDKVMPLNEDTFTQALDAGDIGENVPEFQVRGTGYTEDGSSLRLPFRGRTVLASFMGVSEDQKKKLGEILSRDQQICAGFLHNLTSDKINSWLEAPLPKNLIQTKLAAAPVKRSSAVMVIDAPEEAKTADFTAAEVFVGNGETKVAATFDAVDLTRPISGLSKFLVFEDGTYCPAPEKVAVVKTERTEVDLVNTVLQKCAAMALHRGSTVSFILENDWFSVPAKVASIQADEHLGTITVKMLNGMSQPYLVMLAPFVKEAMFDDKTATWVLPISSKVLEFSEYAEARPMAPEKVAEWFQKRLPDQLVCGGGQFTLSIGGETFGSPQCSEQKIAEILDMWFDNGSMLIQAVKTAAATSVTGSWSVRFDSNLSDKAKEVVKLASEYYAYPELARSVIKDIAIPLESAVKLAATIGDPAGADAILSAGFLSEDNLAEFVSLADQFQDTVGKLARLLLAIRMGFPGDESATTVAMKSLQRVADRLQSAVQETEA